MLERKKTSVCKLPTKFCIYSLLCIDLLLSQLLGYDLKYFDFLEASVKDYITMVNQAHALQNTKSIRSEILLNHAKKHPGQPFIVTCSKDTSLGLVIKDMNYFKIHRIFVTENEKPVGVISQLDVIKKLLETRV